MGGYGIKCSLDNTVEKTATGELKVVNVSAIHVTSVIPDVVYFNESANVNVSGNNFVNTTDLKCLFIYKESVMGLTAEFVSTTEIRCSVLPVRKSVSGNLVLSFAAYKRKSYQQIRVDFHRSINVPELLNGGFSKRLTGIILNFSNRIQLKEKRLSCEDIFPYNFTVFGSKARCKAAGTRLFVEMVGRPSFKPGYVMINMTTIKYAGADYTVHPIELDTTMISRPANSTPPEFSFRVTKKIGN